MTKVRNLNPLEASQLLADNPAAVLLDVRTRAEYDYVGHPIGAEHVTWVEGPGLPPNPDFVDRVRERLHALGRERPEDTPILAICRSGARSAAAAEALAAAGFKELYNVQEGFEGDRDTQGHRNTLNGWRVRGLPWEQT